MKKIFEKGWKEIKREYEIDEMGKEVPKYVTKEYDFTIFGRDRMYFDFIFRSFGILAKLVSLIGIAMTIRTQNKERTYELQQKKAMLDLELYLKALKNINLLLSSTFNDTIWAKARHELSTEVIPTIDLLNTTKKKYLKILGIG